MRCLSGTKIAAHETHLGVCCLFNAHLVPYCNVIIGFPKYAVKYITCMLAANTGNLLIFGISSDLLWDKISKRGIPVLHKKNTDIIYNDNAINTHMLPPHECLHACHGVWHSNVIFICV